jgi:peptide/nickel transport system ATP-binding protein
MAMEPGAPILRVEDLAISYQTRGGTVRAVRGVTFDIAAGETFGLVGESGCGKSTIAFSVMRYLGGNGRVDNGRILFRGDDLLAKSNEELRQIRGDRIAMVYQEPQSALNPAMRVGDQLAEVLLVHRRVSRAQAYRACEEMLGRVRMPDPRVVMQRYPHQLSGGQQQRVVIAMALLPNPDLLIMDEPTTGLDVTVEAAVLDLLVDLQREFSSAILYISHNLGVVARIADRVGVLYAGELIEESPVHDLLARPLHPYAIGLLESVPRRERTAHESLRPIPGQLPSPTAPLPGCAFAPRCSFATSRCQVERPPLEPALGTTRVRCFYWPQVAERQPEAFAPLVPQPPAARSVEAAASPGPFLAAEDVRYYYTQSEQAGAGWLRRGPGGTVKAVDGVNLQLGPGQVLGIVGESGCGKSTLAKCIAGLLAPTEGQLTFLGTDITKPVERRDHRLLRELQMVFQSPDATLNPSHTVGQALARPLQLFRSVPRAQVKQEVRRLLREVKLDEQVAERRPQQLSGGQKQRVAIARAFAGRPRLVLCDEPVSALDVSVQASILNLLLEFRDREGTALIFITHDLAVVRYISDHVAVMYLGEIREVGRTEDIFNPDLPHHPYTIALLSAVPTLDPADGDRRVPLEGSVPSALDPPSGCRFHTRCPFKLGPICEREAPPWRHASGDHHIYCHIPLDELKELP